QPRRHASTSCSRNSRLPSACASARARCGSVRARASRRAASAALRAAVAGCAVSSAQDISGAEGVAAFAGAAARSAVAPGRAARGSADVFAAAAAGAPTENRPARKHAVPSVRTPMSATNGRADMKREKVRAGAKGASRVARDPDGFEAWAAGYCSVELVTIALPRSSLFLLLYVWQPEIWIAPVLWLAAMPWAE